MQRLKQGAWLMLMQTLLIWALPTSGQAAGSTRAEAWISQAQPYAQQTVLYTVRVYHGAVKELNPEPMNIPGVSTERLDGPPETTRTIDRQRLYSDFRYALTPLKPGPVTIPPMRIKVLPGSQSFNRYSNGYPADFIVQTGSVNLDVRPVAATGQAWLPLYSLDLTVKRDRGRGGVARVGEPLTLTVVQRAWGAGGEHLPGVEAQLESPDYKVYSEQPRFTQQVDDRGRSVRGERSQTFTLVPTREGEIRIPPLTIPWWSLRSDRMKTESWPGALVTVVAGGESEAIEATPGEGSDSRIWTMLLVLLVAVASFVLGWWLSAGRPGLGSLLNRQPADEGGSSSGQPQPVTGGVSKLTGRLTGWSDRVGGKLGASVEFLLLVRLRRTLRERLRGLEPRWLALWRLRSRIDKTEDPKQLEALVQRYAALQLGLSEYAALPEIGEVIARDYPELTGTTARELLQRLDASLYGKQSDAPALDRCNKDICCLLRSMGLRCPPSRRQKPRSRLPDLNPRHAP